MIKLNVIFCNKKHKNGREVGRKMETFMFLQTHLLEISISTPENTLSPTRNDTTSASSMT